MRRAAAFAVGWLTLAALGACGGPAPVPNEPGDVILVILDTTRADHLSAYGYSRPTTPHLEQLAAVGVLYEDAWSQAPWTLPAIATILTGQPPHAHGAGRSGGRMLPLRPEVPTAAERLGALGYATAAFMNVIWCRPELSALDRGFDVYDFRGSDASNRGHRDAAATTDAAIAWLDRIGDARAFLVVHYFDPHLTYDPPAPYDTMFEAEGAPRLRAGFGSASEVFKIRDGSLRLSAAERRSLIARYDGEIRYVDEQFGRLRAALEERQRWSDALVVVVADHGEEFWEHGGFEHGHTHYREMLRVPLIVRHPGGPAGERRTERVRQLDIVPTLLDFAGAAPDASLPGRALGGEAAPFSVAEGSLWAGPLMSIRSDLGTLILDRDSGREAFYGSYDTLELQPLPPEASGAAELRSLLSAVPDPAARPDAARKLTEEQIEKLRSLGYIR